VMRADRHIRLSSSSPGREFIESPHNRMQAEKGSCLPGAEVQAEYSPAIEQIGTTIDT